MPDPIIRELFSSGGPGQRGGGVNWKRSEQIPAHSTMAAEGEVPDTVSLLASGWAGRVRQLEDGRRHIIAIILPGELCDHFAAEVGGLDHSIEALTPVVVAKLDRPIFNQLAKTPKAAEAIHREDLLREAMQRQWLTCLGVKTAREKIAHLLCELFYRQKEIGTAEGNECPFMLTQKDVAEFTGMTTVHVNRTLQALRADGLIELWDRRLRIPDIQALGAETEFDPAYLKISQDEGSSALVSDGLGERQRVKLDGLPCPQP